MFACVCLPVWGFACSVIGGNVITSQRLLSDASLVFVKSCLGQRCFNYTLACVCVPVWGSSPYLMEGIAVVSKWLVSHASLVPGCRPVVS